jgi:glycosyltransferase involved in cell wall biosynthesis
MPVYDAEEYLRQSIDSVLGQTFGNFELLIISEHNTSNESIAIIESYSDKRIRHIHNTTTLGLVRSLNAGLKAAKGQYIALMDADDVSLPQRFEREVRFLDTHPSVSVVGTAFQIIDENNRLIGRHSHPTDPALIRWELMFNDVIANSSALVRRSIYDQIGGYDQEFVESAMDYELWTRAARIADLANLPDTLLLFRQHRSSMSRMHYQALVRNTMTVCRRALAIGFHQDTPLAIVRAFVQPRSMGRAKDALDAAELLYKLFVRHTSQEGLTEHQATLVRYDAGRRMLGLAVACATRSPLFSLKILCLVAVLCRERSVWFAISMIPILREHLWQRLISR